MKRVEALREHAKGLRALAEGFDGTQIKEELLFLAERCDRLALIVASEISDRLQQPISGLGSGRDGGKAPTT